MKQERIEPCGTIEQLDALSRTRPLTQLEVIRLERALKARRERKGETKVKPHPWSRSELSRLRRYLSRGKKPAQIAPLIKRTERAIWRKMYQQGWAVGMLCPESIFTPSRHRARVQSRGEG